MKSGPTARKGRIIDKWAGFISSSGRVMHSNGYFCLIKLKKANIQDNINISVPG